MKCIALLTLLFANVAEAQSDDVCARLKRANNNTDVRAIDTRKFNIYEKVWSTDEQSNDKLKEMVIFKPVIRPGEYFISYTPRVDNKEKNWSNEQPAFGSTIARENECSNKALAEPDGFTCQLGIGVDDEDVSFVRPLCPDGYVSLSDFAVGVEKRCETGERIPDDLPESELPDKRIRCVDKNLTVITDLGNQFWTGKGGIMYYANHNSLEGFRMDLEGSRFAGETRRLSNLPAPVFKDLNEVLTLSNPTHVDQSMSFSVSRGITSTRTEENNVSTEFRMDVSVATEAKVPFVGGVDVETSFGFSSFESTTISKSDIISQNQETKVDIIVPAFSTAKLAQLVVIDPPSRGGTSTMTLFTTNFALEIIPLDNNSTNSTNSNSSTSLLSEIKAILEKQTEVLQNLQMQSSSNGYLLLNITNSTGKMLEQQNTTHALLSVTAEAVETNKDGKVRKGG